MTETSGRTGRRLGLEAITIIASILAAFAIDASWVEWGERKEGRESIAGLLGEFRETEQRVSVLRTRLEENAEGARTLLLLADGSQLASESQLDSLLFLLVRRNQLNTSEANLTALITAGRLGLIRDDSLRVALAGWDEVRSVPARSLEWDNVTVGEHVLPYLWDRVSMRAVDGAGGLQALGPGLHAHEPRELLGDRKFQNLVNERIALIVSALRGLASLEDHLQTTLRLLEKQG